MRILISHNSFPGQFRHIAEHLGRIKGNQVVFATENPRPEWTMPGVTKATYSACGATGTDIHILSKGIDNSVRHGAAMLKLCLDLKQRGFVPDVILGHSGEGQTLFIKDAFPNTPFIGYFEWYFNSQSEEILFDCAERNEIQAAQLRMRNSVTLQDLASCQAGVTPTAWQLAQFPKEFQSKISRIHDGINTSYFAPAEGGKLPIESLDLPNTDLTGARELVTYCARGLEPYRGFPQFYEALPAILDARPECHVLIVGEDRTCYSPCLLDNQTYKKLMQDKVKLDQSRVHFTGPLPYGQYKQVLQASSAHVYLTWPFVLSWSLLEALSCGCLVVASDTEPVREVMHFGENGLKTDFHSPEKIAKATVEALTRQDELAPLRQAARQTILDTYSLNKCLPAHMNLLIKTIKEGTGNTH